MKNNNIQRVMKIFFSPSHNFTSITFLGILCLYSPSSMASPSYTFGPVMPTSPSAGGMGANLMRGLTAGSNVNCALRGICPHPQTNIAIGTETDPRKGLAMARRIMKDVMDELPAEPGEHYTRPYTRRNGSHVSGHYATNPDISRLNNWSTRGNITPHTGQEGHADPSPITSNPHLDSLRLQGVSTVSRPTSHHIGHQQSNSYLTGSLQPPLAPPVPVPPESMDH